MCGGAPLAAPGPPPGAALRQESAAARGGALDDVAPPMSSAPGDARPRAQGPRLRDRPLAPWPCFDDLCLLVPPPANNRPRLHQSIVHQVDGLLFKAFGVRLEADVCAPTTRDPCFTYGRPPEFMPLSAVDGFYVCSMLDLPLWVATAVSHHARGAFLLRLPLRDEVEPVFGKLHGPTSKAVATEWRVALAKSSRLTFLLGDDAFVGAAPEGQWSVVFASFEHALPLRTSRLPVDELRLSTITELHAQPALLDVVPTLFARAMCTDTAVRPTLLDESPAEAPLLSSMEVPVPLERGAPTTWNVPVFEEWASDYPCEMVRRLAKQAVRGEMEVFSASDLTRTTRARNSPKIAGRESEIRDHLLKEVVAGRMLGPFARSPFVNGRFCKLSLAPKHRWDASRTEFRLISDFSSGGPSSVNDLCFSPKLASFHLQPVFIGDLLASRGPGVTFIAADTPKCFRQLLNPARLLQLFQYNVPEGGVDQIFVDLRNSFGWRPSEWSWQCVLAVLMWRQLRAHGKAPMCFVDNYFFIGARAAEEYGQFVTDSAAVGMALHEHQDSRVAGGNVVVALGWEWRTQEPMAMVCPQDKHESMCRMLLVWSRDLPYLSLDAVRSATGLMAYIAGGFTYGRADLAAMYRLRAKGEAMASRSNRLPEDVMLQLPEGSAAITAIRFWCSFFPSWSRSRALVASFSPCNVAQVFAASDACTHMSATRPVPGMGGFTIDLRCDPPKACGFSCEFTGPSVAAAWCELRESTTVLEVMAAEKLLAWAAPKVADTRFLLLLDNAAAVLALDRGHSRLAPLAAPLVSARRTVAAFNLTLRVRFVLGNMNLLADLLSHGRVTDAVGLAWQTFGWDLVVEDGNAERRLRSRR